MPRPSKMPQFAIRELRMCMKHIKRFEEDSNWKTTAFYGSPENDELLDSGQHNKVREIIDALKYIANHPTEFDESDLNEIRMHTNFLFVEPNEFPR